MRRLLFGALHGVQVVVELLDAGKHVQGGQGVQDLEDLLDRRLEVDENHFRAALLQVFFRLQQHPDRHAVDVVHELHVENHQVRVLAENGFDLLCQHSVGFGVEGADGGYGEHSRFLQHGVDFERHIPSHRGCNSPDRLLPPAHPAPNQRVKNGFRFSINQRAR
jgi:hypothetical protein